MFDIEVEIHARPETNLEEKLQDLRGIIDRFSTVSVRSNELPSLVNFQIGDREKNRTVQIIDEILEMDEEIRGFKTINPDDINFSAEYFLKIPYPLTSNTLRNTSDVLNLVTKKMYELVKYRFQCKLMNEERARKAAANNPSAPVQVKEESDPNVSNNIDLGLDTVSTDPGSGLGNDDPLVETDVDSWKENSLISENPYAEDDPFKEYEEKAKEFVEKHGYDPKNIFPAMCDDDTDGAEQSTVAFFYVLAIRDMMVRFSMIRNEFAEHLLTLKTLQAGTVPEKLVNKLDKINAIKPLGSMTMQAKVDQCVKNLKGLDCILQITLREQDGEAKLVIPVPVTHKNVTVIADLEWKKPIKRSNTLEVAEATDCEVDHTCIRCPYAPQFETNECIHEAYMKNLKGMINHCKGKLLRHETSSQPYIKHMKGQTILVSYQGKPLSVMVGPRRLPDLDGVDIRHNVPVQVKYGLETTEEMKFTGNTRMLTNEYRQSWFNDKQKEELILGWFPDAFTYSVLGKLSESYDSLFLSETTKDVILLASIILGSLLTVFAAVQLIIVIINSWKKRTQEKQWEKSGMNSKALNRQEEAEREIAAEEVVEEDPILAPATVTEKLASMQGNLKKNRPNSAVSSVKSEPRPTAMSQAAHSLGARPKTYGTYPGRKEVKEHVPLERKERPSYPRILSSPSGIDDESDKLSQYSRQLEQSWESIHGSYPSNPPKYSAKRRAPQPPIMSSYRHPSLSPSAPSVATIEMNDYGIERQNVDPARSNHGPSDPESEDEEYIRLMGNREELRKIRLTYGKMIRAREARIRALEEEKALRDEAVVQQLREEAEDQRSVTFDIDEMEED